MNCFNADPVFFIRDVIAQNIIAGFEADERIVNAAVIHIAFFYQQMPVAGRQEAPDGAVVIVSFNFFKRHNSMVLIRNLYQ